MAEQYLVHELAALGHEADLFAPLVFLIDDDRRQSVADHTLDHGRNRRPGHAGLLSQL